LSLHELREALSVALPSLLHSLYWLSFFGLFCILDQSIRSERLWASFLQSLGFLGAAPPSIAVQRILPCSTCSTYGFSNGQRFFLLLEMASPLLENNSKQNNTTIGRFTPQIIVKLPRLSPYETQDRKISGAKLYSTGDRCGLIGVFIRTLRHSTIHSS